MKGSGSGGSGSGGGGGSGSGGGGGSGGRRGRSEDTRVRKKKSEVANFTVPEILTKPAIESSNPFFIAVCAPETYKPRLGGGGGGGGGDKEKRENVFLRQRSRSRNTETHNGGSKQTNYPNRFIQHSQSKSIISPSPMANVVVEPVVLNSNEHFPSLGSGVSSSTQSKLNFKEMVMRNTSTANTTTTTTTTAMTGSTATNEVKLAYPRVLPSLSLSSNNIFLAAFQAPRSDEDDDDDDYDTSDNNNTRYTQRVVSSALIDTCDKKYDKLYR